MQSWLPGYLRIFSKRPEIKPIRPASSSTLFTSGPAIHNKRTRDGPLRLLRHCFHQWRLFAPFQCRREAFQAFEDRGPSRRVVSSSVKFSAQLAVNSSFAASSDKYYLVWRHMKGIKLGVQLLVWRFQKGWVRRWIGNGKFPPQSRFPKLFCSYPGTRWPPTP